MRFSQSSSLPLMLVLQASWAQRSSMVFSEIPQELVELLYNSPPAFDLSNLWTDYGRILETEPTMSTSAMEVML